MKHSILDLERIEDQYHVKLNGETLCIQPFMVDVVRFLRAEYRPVKLDLYSDRIEITTTHNLLNRPKDKELLWNLH